MTPKYVWNAQKHINGFFIKMNNEIDCLLLGHFERSKCESFLSRDASWQRVHVFVIDNTDGVDSVTLIGLYVLCRK